MNLSARAFSAQATEQAVCALYNGCLKSRCCGGDAGIIRKLYKYLNRSYNGFHTADIRCRCKNMIGFAAEQTRYTNIVTIIADHYKQSEK